MSTNNEINFNKKITPAIAQNFAKEFAELYDLEVLTRGIEIIFPEISKSYYITKEVTYKDFFEFLNEIKDLIDRLPKYIRELKDFIAELHDSDYEKMYFLSDGNTPEIQVKFTTDEISLEFGDTIKIYQNFELASKVDDQKYKFKNAIIETNIYDAIFDITKEIPIDSSFEQLKDTLTKMKNLDLKKQLKETEITGE